ncbi:hypothetical protein FTX61_07575 [Nitriliruptoraceae bacterium ZYF776]|nr:hypothetical protein [Profundirhabdus halotolerans]
MLGASIRDSLPAGRFHVEPGRRVRADARRCARRCHTDRLGWPRRPPGVRRPPPAGAPPRWPWAPEPVGGAIDRRTHRGARARPPRPVDRFARWVPPCSVCADPSPRAALPGSGVREGASGVRWPRALVGTEGPRPRERRGGGGTSGALSGAPRGDVAFHVEPNTQPSPRRPTSGTEVVRDVIAAPRPDLAVPCVGRPRTARRSDPGGERKVGPSAHLRARRARAAAPAW